MTLNPDSPSDKHSDKKADRTPSSWRLGIELAAEEINRGRWSSLNWKVKQLWPDEDSWQQSLSQQPRNADLTTFLDLVLYRDERSAYRFNLASVQPHLFIQCDEDEENDRWIPNEITACQDVAAEWLDGEHSVLETPMPEAIQCWLEAYMAEHGELIEHKKKRRYAEGGKKKQREAL